MTEILAVIALILALLALAGSSAPVAAFFITLAVGCVIWRAYKAHQVAKNAESEVRGLRAELQRLTTLTERAVRIAAETANDLATLKQRTVVARSEAPEPSSPIEAKPLVQEPIAPPKPEPVTPRVEEIPSWTAGVKAPSPTAPLIQQPMAPQIPVAPVAPAPLPAPTAAPPSIPAAPPRPVFAATSAPPKPPRKALDMEEMLGKNWLSKIGVIMIVLAIASYGIYELGRLGSLGKIGLCLAVSAAMLAGGIFLERNERYKVLGRTGIGGGWALLFFTAYALNHVEAMRVVSSTVADALLMLIVAGAMVIHTLRYKSQLVTGSAFLLAYSTIALSHDTVYSLVASAILAAALVTIIVRRGWYELEIFAILSSYGNHLYWLYRLLGPNGAGGRPFPEFLPSTSLLVFYWAAFRTSYVVRKIQTAAQEQLSTVAAILNTVFLLFVMRFQSARPQLAFYALLVLGAIEFGIGQLPITKKRRSAFVVLTIIGVVLMLAAVPMRYSGNNVSILWLMGGEMLLFAGIFTAEQLFRRLGLLTGLVSVAWVIVRDLPRMLEVRAGGSEPTMVADGVLLFAMAAVFYANNVLLRKRWPLLFADPFDDGLLTITSYPGAITLALACWATFAGDQMAVAYASAMLAVALLGWMIKSRHLQWQSLALAVLTGERAFDVNAHWGLDHHHLASRLVSLSVITAMYYVTAKFGLHRDDAEQRIVRGVFAVCGTFFGTVLLFAELDNHFVAAAWVLFALALTAASRWTKWNPLGWHAFAMGILSAGQASFVNLFDSTPNTHNTVRLTVTLIVIVGLYAMSELLRFPAAAQPVAAVLAWLGTGLAGGLMWYELSPVTIAVGWALLGLALFEFSAWRKSVHWRWQAYLALAAAFVRIFFANLATGEGGEWLSTRMVTVVPIVAIFYYVYLRETEFGKAATQRFSLATIFAYFGTAAVMALTWFQFANEWVVVAWAALVIVLLAVAVLARQSLFAQQAVLVAIGVLGRGMFHNLFGGSYFSGSDWRGRFGVLGAAIALLFASLPLAFEQRRRSEVGTQLRGFRRVLTVMEHRAEQPIFFVAVALLTTMLALKMDHGMVSLSWGVEAVIIFIGALFAKERSFRLTGLCLLLLCLGKIVIVDLWSFSTPQRILTLGVVGAVSVAVSLLYGRYSERIREYL